MTQQELVLPKGWISDLFTICFYHVPTGVKNFDGLKDYYSTGSIKNSKITSEGKFNFEQKPSRASRLAKKNDVFQARMEKAEKSLLVNDDFNESLFSTGFLQFRALAGCSPKYLFYLLGSGIFLTQRDKFSTGTTQKSLTDSGLKRIVIPLAPLNEQKRIASKIEESFSNIDSTKQSLEYTKLQLEQYRYSLLKSIFEGKELVKTGEVCEGVVPGRYKPKVFDGDIPWITTPDLDGLYISKSKKNLCVSRKEAKKVRMKIMPKGTVLLTCVGDLGRICITKNEVVPNQQFHGFVCTEKILPEYLAHALTIQIRQILTSSTATTISYMNKTTCNNLKIPLASSIEEQEQIVSQIEQGFSLIENSQRIVNSTLQTLDTMRMSVLKQAFQGKLVPQDPNDEPASVLLERIKKEK